MTKSLITDDAKFHGGEYIDIWWMREGRSIFPVGEILRTLCFFMISAQFLVSLNACTQIKLRTRELLIAQESFGHSCKTGY